MQHHIGNRISVAYISSFWMPFDREIPKLYNCWLNLYTTIGILRCTFDVGILSITTKPSNRTSYRKFWTNEIANVLRDNMGSKKFSLQPKKKKSNRDFDLEISHLRKKFSCQPQKCKLELCMSNGFKVLIYLSLYLSASISRIVDSNPQGLISSNINEGSCADLPPKNMGMFILFYYRG